MCVPNKKTLRVVSKINVFIGTNTVWKSQNQILTVKKGADMQISAPFSCVVRKSVAFEVRYEPSVAPYASNGSRGMSFLMAQCSEAYRWTKHKKSTLFKLPQKGIVT